MFIASLLNIGTSRTPPVYCVTTAVGFQALPIFMMSAQQCEVVEIQILKQVSNVVEDAWNLAIYLDRCQFQPR